MTPSTAVRARTTRYRRLLTCGTVAGVVFPVLSFAQALTRPGFDLRRHAISALTLGELGWLQVATFTVTGLLACAFAVGLRWALRPGRADTAAPALVAVYGVAMVGGGIFTPDPAFGWPAGAPDGMPAQASTGSVLHTVFGAAAFLSLIAAGLVVARRYAGEGRRALALHSVASSVVAFVLTVPPWSEDSASLRFAAAAVVISGWLVVLSRQARAGTA